MGWDQDEARWSNMMAKAQAGDESAYRILLGELATTIEKYLNSRFGGYNFIDDCVQECLISIHNARHTYSTQRAFRPWFFAIVKNKAIDFLRARNRTTAHHSDVDIDLISEDGQVEVLDNRITQGQLLAGLKQEHREVIVLCKLEGYSIDEAAKRLEISPGAVKLRVHRALKALKKHIEVDSNE